MQQVCKPMLLDSQVLKFEPKHCENCLNLRLDFSILYCPLVDFTISLISPYNFPLVIHVTDKQ